MKTFALKEKLLGVWKAVKHEFTRLDRTCNNCGREIFGGETVAEKYFCKDCAENLPFNNGFVCSHCGRRTVAPTELCDDCTGFESSFARARSPFYYAPPVDKLIRDAKFENRRYLAEVLGSFAADTFEKNFSDADMITFVPMSAKERKAKGYNHAELICRGISKLTGARQEETIVKVAETDRQARLGRNDRLKNLKSVFKVRNKALIEGKTVVLTDDVLTTGATAEACSAALIKGGAKRVYVLTIASVTDPKVARALGQETGRIKNTLKKRARKLSKNAERKPSDKKRK